MHGIILGIANWALVAALLVSLPRDRMWLTAPVTCVAIGVVAVVYALIPYWDAFVPCAVMCACWAVLSARAVRRELTRRATIGNHSQAGR